MKSKRLIWYVILCGIALGVLLSCAQVPVKRNYLLSYVPEPMTKRMKQGAYPYILRLRDFDIEEAYDRPQIVYRQSPFELRYYSYRVWAVKPTRMITDLIHKHILDVNLFSSIIRRYEEGVGSPDFELSGMITAIEEYDSDEVWFGHLAIRFHLTRMSDGKIVYTRTFDNRKRVYEKDPEQVIRAISQIMEFILNQVSRDIDVVLAREYGIAQQEQGTVGADADSTMDTPDVWNTQQ